MTTQSDRVFINIIYIVFDQRRSFKSTIFKLSKFLKLWSRLGIFTKQDLYIIVGNLNEERAIKAFKAIK